MVLKLILAAAAVAGLAACTPLGIAGDVAVGTAQVAVGAADLLI